jgi:hypothetical protein
MKWEKSNWGIIFFSATNTKNTMKIIQKISRVSIDGVKVNVVRLQMTGVKFRPLVKVLRNPNSQR